MNTVNMEKKRYEDENNEDHTFFTFLKIYVADSETGKYSQKDVLSIDFDAMEAFTYIKRIEKKVKEQVLENQDYLQLGGNFPICVFSRENLFNSTSISIKNVDGKVVPVESEIYRSGYQITKVGYKNGLLRIVWIDESTNENKTAFMDLAHTEVGNYKGYVYEEGSRKPYPVQVIRERLNI